MRGIGRLLFLLAVAGFFVWFFVSQQPDRQTTVHSPARPPAERPADPTPSQPWTQEERAVWRDSVDRRMRP